MTIYNFSAGPLLHYRSVLEKSAGWVLNYLDSSMSVLEIFTVLQRFDKIVKDAEATLRELVAIPDN